MIDVGEWLGSRTPAPPPELAERLERIAAGRACIDAADLSRLLVGEAESLLATLPDDRSGAIDLLLADSLITYGLEAAADDCTSLEAAATGAMQRIAAIASRSAVP